MNDINIYKINFKNNIDEIINGDIFMPEKKGKFPLIIMSHGFKAWKDWGFNPFLAKELCKSGSITLTFNFSLNGRIKNPDFIDVEKFARNSISQELADLNAIVEYFVSHQDNILDEVREKWNGEIILFGFSLGGGISILKSKSDNRISKLVLWSTIGKFDRYTERQRKEWKLKSFVESPNRQTNQILKLNYNYLEDIELNKKIFNLADAIGTIEIPILIIHGGKDITVPLEEVEALFEAERNYNIRKKIIARTGHTFGIIHPMSKFTKALQEALTETKDFLFNF